MKRLLHILVIIALVMLTLGAALPAQAATPAAIQAAIDAGLPWLASQQAVDGSWNGYVGPTGLALLKFETHAIFMGKSPLDPTYVYSTNVQKGLDFIFSQALPAVIGVQPAGDPDTNGNGIGIWSSNIGEPMYECGISTMAVVASGAPDKLTTTGPANVINRKYKDVATDMLDYLCWAQNEGAGGWTYYPNDGPYGDNSVSGYVALGLAYAEAPAPWGFGLTIPPFVLSELNNWINFIQTSGGSEDGGSGYWSPGSWVNILKTGNLLAQMALVGDTQATPRVQKAVAYIARHWNDANYDPGWRNDYQACFTTMKGFQSLGITLIDVNNDGTPERDWYDDMSTMICSTQNVNGSWPNYGQFYVGTTSTSWAMLTLEKAAPPALGLTPPFATNPQNTPHTVTAEYKIAGVPQAGVTINFSVIAGPNIGESGSNITDQFGKASFTYTGDSGIGTDTIRATAVNEAGAPLVSAQATKEWTEGGPGPGPEVGGNIYPANKLVILTPWLVLAIVLAVGTTILIRRRQNQS